MAYQNPGEIIKRKVSNSNVSLNINDNYLTWSQLKENSLEDSPRVEWQRLMALSFPQFYNYFYVCALVRKLIIVTPRANESLPEKQKLIIRRYDSWTCSCITAVEVGYGPLTGRPATVTISYIYDLLILKIIASSALKQFPHFFCSV